jgi:hypothetical protein
MKNLLILITLSLLIFACSNDENQSDEPEVVQTPPVLAISELENSAIQPTDEPETITHHIQHESVLGYRYIDTESWDIASMTSGSTFSLALADELSVDAEVVRVMRPMQNILSFTARITGDHEGDVSITLDGDRISANISVSDLSRNFHIRYDVDADQHYITEIDVQKLDAIEGGVPLTPIEN